MVTTERSTELEVLAATPFENWVGAREAARILRVSYVTVIRWAGTGYLPSLVKLPGMTGAWYFDRGVVEQLAEDRARAKQVLAWESA
ncbi:helix-turn-helix domain-containing protein [Nocardia wallacei]|uniref:helix-turn-helix domain-containing protein n=1 Tax=Nocardia wallacei TaxID=480035 RepID=UPI002456CC95|nr:helix-turn-helix domain-containing protein [Nocardia wallacei]